MQASDSVFALGNSWKEVRKLLSGKAVPGPAVAWRLQNAGAAPPTPHPPEALVTEEVPSRYHSLKVTGWGVG